MEVSESKVAIKLLPSMTDFAFLMPMLYLFCRMHGMLNLLGDCDTGWHIRTGQWILANRRIPNHDMFSYSKPNGVWYAWEWLSDVVLAFLNSQGGLAAVAIFAILIISLTFTFVFRLARVRSNAIVAVCVTMVAAAASSIHWLARPHLFTLLFVTLFYAALERVRQGERRYLWLLPPAVAVWTNLHGGFLAGIVMIAAYGIAELLRIVLDPSPEARAQARRCAPRYFICAFAALLASLLNPYTWHLHVHLIQYLGNSFESQHIAEFLSINFHHPAAIFFETLLILGVMAAVRSIRERTYVEAVLIVLWMHAALLAVRNIPLFAIVAAPPVAAMLTAWLRELPQFETAAWLRTAASRFNRVADELSQTDAIGRWHLVSALGAALVAAMVLAPHPPKSFRPEFDPQTYPASAVSRISTDVLDRGQSAHIFTYDQWGDYLIYRLYPRTQVFLDGRTDFYGSEFVQKAIDATNVKYGWEETLSRFGVDTVLLPPGMPLAGALKLSSRWRLIYDDGVAVLFRSVSAPGATTSVASSAGASPISPVSAIPAMGRGISRDREVTKTEAPDPRIEKPKSTI